MTWEKFWTICENHFDRFYTIAAVILALDMMNGTPLHLVAAFGCMAVAFIGGLTSAACALLSKESINE
jgi:hypothetical protein